MNPKEVSTVSKQLIKTNSSRRPFHDLRSRFFSIGVALVFGSLLAGCITYEDIDSLGVASLNTPQSEKEFMEEWIESNELMAYVMNEDNNIYVDDEAVPEIQESLKATIDNGVWQYQNADGQMIKRNQKPLNVKNYSNRIAIVKWSFARGYDCQEKPKGYKLPIHQAGDRNRKIVAAYETTEKGNWCIDNRSFRCKFGWKKVTTKLIKVNRNGKLRKRRGKYLRHKEQTLTIMACVK